MYLAMRDETETNYLISGTEDGQIVLCPENNRAM